MIPCTENTLTASNGYKTRKFTDIISEVRHFFDIHKAEGTHAGGVQFELTGKDVQECLGGDQDITAENLSAGHYENFVRPQTQCQSGPGAGVSTL